MSVVHYAVGTGGLVVLVAALAWTAVRLRRILLPGWTGAPARLAEGVLGLSTFVAVAELLGTVGLFRAGPLLAMTVVTAALAPRLASRLLPSPSPTRPPAQAGSRVAAAAAVGLAALVVGHWTAHVLVVLDGGTLSPDSMRYHLPFAARFYQTGDLTRLHFVASEPHATFFPATSELLHAVAMTLFRRDVLSPFMNFAWLGMALLAGWCVGRPTGRAAVTMGGTTVIAALPVMAADQPGTALNDMAALALLLAAAALVLNGGRHRPALAVAGLAVGLAVGTKLTALAPAAALTVALAVAAPRGRRRAVVAAWSLPAAAVGSFWYLRNLVRASNPLPWLAFGIGPWRLPSPPMPIVENQDFSVAHYATDTWFWQTTVPRGLHAAFGRVWPVVVALAAAGLVAAVVRGGWALRALGVTGLVSAAAYLVTPYSAGGPEGNPVLFVFDLRFLAPALGLGLVLLPLTLPSRLAVAAGAAYAAVVVAMQFHRGLYVLWPPGRLGAGLAVAAGVVLLAAVLRVAALRSPRLAGAVALSAALVLLAAGWPVQHHYLRHRYGEGRSGRSATWAWAGDVRGARIAVAGFTDQYPLYGRDLSNVVQFEGVRGPRGTWWRAATCAAWRRALRAGRYHYVVAAPFFGAKHAPLEADWTRRDPGAVEVLSVDNGAVFRLDRPPDPAACAGARARERVTPR